MPNPLEWIGENKLELDSIASSVLEDSGAYRLLRASSVESEGQPSEGNINEKDASSFVKEVVRNAQGGGVDGNEANTIRMLEHALEEEHATCIALYFELEKERSAAATAADEAMAMILRLQEEKASIEMEARQYQRLNEEKSAYDKEEMNILKEILVRREREKHFLEKEVEAYRDMMHFGERNLQLENDVHDMVGESGQRPYSSFDSSEDPVLMLQRIHESIRKKEMQKNRKRCSEEGLSTEIQSGPCVLEKELLSLNRIENVDFSNEGDVQNVENAERHSLLVPECMGRCNLEYLEKGMVSMNECSSSLQGDVMQLGVDSFVFKSNGPLEHGLHERTYHFLGEEHEKEDKTIILHAAAQSGDENCSKIGLRFLHGAGEQEDDDKDAGQKCSSYQTSLPGMESSVHDVHVIDHESKTCNERIRYKSELSPLNNTSKSSMYASFPLETIDALRGHSGQCIAEAVPNTRNSSSDMSLGFPPNGSSRCKVVLSSLQHNSMLSIDERLKLETEVGWLRDRLKVVQEGREKLKLTKDHSERENVQLQILEEISTQLEEICSLTQLGKVGCQAAMSPSSSQVYSKK